ncbi:MAG: hypothetical protein WBE37_23890 [Bryobacteraceae bacterium]
MYFATASVAVFVFLPGARADSTFEFHSGFWVNLHHFLYEQAGSQTPLADDSPAWQRALEYYRREVVKRNLLSDEAATINNRLSGLDNAPALRDSGLPPGLIAALEAAAPIYKARWWPDHDRANRAWIAAVTPLVSKYSESLKKELAAAYQTGWPAAPIRTDVTEYASFAGAYTTLDPTHITVSSINPGNQGDAALEVLFHEASHAMVGKIRTALEDEASRQHKLLRRRDFWHALLFYTTGEIVEQHRNGYVPYAVKNGLYNRAWPGAPEVLDADWKPYLDGKIDLAAAVHRLVLDYGAQR